MKALHLTAFGKPSTLALAELERPRADAGHAVVEVRAAAINPSDVKNAAGLMRQTTLPRVPGRDFAGVVVEGPEPWLDQAVWGSGGEFGYTRDGSHAEYLRVPVAALSRKPKSLDFAQAASVGVAYTIAWLGLVDYAGAEVGETVLVIGANGSVGRSVIQLARWRGCRIVAVDRHPLADDLRESGLVDASFLPDEQMPQNVRAVTGGRGAEVVYDAVGGVMFEPALHCLAHRGRLVEISATGMSRVDFDLRDFYHNESRLFGADSLKLDGAATARLLDKLAPLFDHGTLPAPVVHHQVPLQGAIEAYEAIAAGEPGRRVVLPQA